MDIQVFISKLTEIFEEANPGIISPETHFRELEGYSSIVAFLIISMINEDFKVPFSGEDLRKSSTISDVFSIIKSRR